MLNVIKSQQPFVLIGDCRSIDVHSHLQNLQRITSIHSPRLLNHSIRLSRYGHDLPCGLDFCVVFLNSSKFCRSDDFVAVGQTNEYNLCANRTNATNAIFMCLVLLCSTLVQSQNSVRVQGAHGSAAPCCLGTDKIGLFVVENGYTLIHYDSMIL